MAREKSPAPARPGPWRAVPVPARESQVPCLGRGVRPACQTGTARQAARHGRHACRPAGTPGPLACRSLAWWDAARGSGERPSGRLAEREQRASTPHRASFGLGQQASSEPASEARARPARSFGRRLSLHRIIACCMHACTGQRASNGSQLWPLASTQPPANNFLQTFTIFYIFFGLKSKKPGKHKITGTRANFPAPRADVPRAGPFKACAGPVPHFRAHGPARHGTRA